MFVHEDIGVVFHVERPSVLVIIRFRLCVGIVLSVDGPVLGLHAVELDKILS